MLPTNTVTASRSALYAASLPAGLTDDGLPVGVLIGKPYDEAVLLSPRRTSRHTVRA